VEWCKERRVAMLRMDNVEYVQATKEEAFVRELWDGFRTDGENLASYLEIEDNFAIAVEEGNEEGMDFYLLVYYLQPFVV